MFIGLLIQLKDIVKATTVQPIYNMFINCIFNLIWNWIQGGMKEDCTVIKIYIRTHVYV